MDKLKEIFNIQKEFTEKFFLNKLNIKIEDLLNDKELLVHWNKEYILSITKEIYEVLDEIDWKTHTKKYSIDVRDNLLEECIDGLKYLIGLMIINGFNEEDIYNKFIAKSSVVESKFIQQQKIKDIVKDNNKIAFIDIDGIIADWPNSFIKFVNDNTNNNFKNIVELNSNLDRNIYHNLKYMYRVSGYKTSINILPNIKELIDYLHNINIHIILLTSRPYKKIFRIYSDTLEFLKKNNIYFDAIIWEEDKEKYIIENFKKDKVFFCLDDDINNVNKLSPYFRTFFKKNINMYENSMNMENTISKLVDKNVIIIEDIKKIYEWIY